MTGRRLAALLLAATVMVAAGSLFYFGSATPIVQAKVQAKGLAKNSPAPARRSAKGVSVPMFFETNQGQTDPQVKFLSRGGGYSLFLTPGEAVLRLRVDTRPAASPADTAKNPAPDTAVIRMRLDGANSAARVSGAELLPGKSNYLIGNNPAKWHRNIPQYARVNYESAYPGIGLTYYGHQGQLEYDFHVAPGADPNQIALTFDGASTRLDSGDLVLSTSNGHNEVRFHAPFIYQPDGNAKKTVAGSFRQMAGNKIGFQIGSYDHSRELVIDPTLSYFTYLGGSGTESNTQVAVDPSLNIYLAGTTDSADFPVTNGSVKTGTTNIFVAKLDPTNPPPLSQLIYATYLGGTGTDNIAGIAVDSSGQAYVAGITTSTDFPHSTDPFQKVPLGPGTHGFLTKLDVTGTTLPYSTYLSGTNASGTTTDLVTGLAIDASGRAFLTGTTTSTDIATGFPATPSGYQLTSLASTQFFASKIDTTQSGEQSMRYSTYFGGATPTDPQITGGGIAVDNGGNMYFTGATDFIFDPAGFNDNPRTNFPILNAQQNCLDQPPSVTACDLNQTATDAFVAKINPNRAGTVSLVYSTYLGGSLDDGGLGIAADGAGNAYVTGQTLSSDWSSATTIGPFQPQFANGHGIIVNNHDAFIAKIGNPTGSSTTYPLTYFTYLGGTGDDVGLSIAVDAVQGVHVTGSTGSSDLPVLNPLTQQLTFGGKTDGFVGQIITTNSGRAAGDYLVYMGGTEADRGTGIAVDANETVYVVGETQSSAFPEPDSPPAPPPFQPSLNAGSQDAFLATIAETSTFAEPADAPPTASPNPASLGNQVTFTFTFVNNGPDPAAGVIFKATFPATGVTFNSASSSPGGTCQTPVGGTVLCAVGPVAVNSRVTASVVLTPTTGTTALDVKPFLSSDGNAFVVFPAISPPVPVTDFAISVAPTSVTLTAGESTSFVATLTPVPTYSSTITMSDSGLPTGATGIFTSTSVALSGSSPGTTTLNISTTARTTTNTSLFRRGAIFAAWLPIGGLSLLGLGVGAGVKRRRGLAGMLLGLLAGLILLQPACGNSSSSSTTSGTPAGTYTIVITGSSGLASHNQHVTMIVN